MILHILLSAFPKTCIPQVILSNKVLESKKAYKTVFKIYKYIVMSKL